MSQFNHIPHLTKVLFVTKRKQPSPEWLADQASKPFQLVFISVSICQLFIWHPQYLGEICWDFISPYRLRLFRLEIPWFLRVDLQSLNVLCICALGRYACYLLNGKLLE